MTEKQSVGFESGIRKRADSSKDKIYFHRAYRIIPRKNLVNYLWSAVALVIVPEIIIILFYSELTHIISRLTSYVLSFSISSDFIEMLAKPYLYEDIFIVVVPGRYPSLELSIVVAIISSIVLTLILMAKKYLDPMSIWMMLLSFVNLVSSIFFIFFADYFPYGVEVFSDLYMKTQVAMWLVIPVIITLSIIAFPTSFFGKLFLVIFTMGYSIAFTAARYILFLFLLRETTYVFMAIMFFIFGPFIDFLALVGFYSFYIYLVEKRTSKDLSVWRWSYRY
ncbi:MAG: hypothetical protein GF307_02470 [candidate division Zixibacteria bacterium]|nr:hypothetical protein [candidate division Zixibacteria bacterium]